MKTLMVQVIFALLLGALALPSAQATSVLGQITIRPNSSVLEMVLASGVSVTIVAKPEMQVSLRRLKTGDLIAVTGHFNDSKTHLTVESLDRIGIQDLLGAWQSSQKKEILEFKDFHELNVYIAKSAGEGNLKLAEKRTLNYVITPERSQGFSLFISNERGEVRMAYMRLDNQATPKRLELTLTDFETGQRAEKLSLSPISLQ